MDKSYYQKMLLKERLIPFIKNDRLVCFITFYIGSKNDKNRFIRDDPWTVLDDDSNGDICWIDQLITDKHPDNPRLSFEIWHRFKEYIRWWFPKTKIIRWNRWKNGKVNVYIKKERENVHNNIDG